MDLMSKISGTCRASEIRLVANRWDANFLEPSLLSNTLDVKKNMKIMNLKCFFIIM